MSYSTRLLPLTVTVCPVCGILHEYRLEVRHLAPPESTAGVVVFGGPVDRKPNPQPPELPPKGIPSCWHVALHCTTIDKTFVQEVSVQPNPGETIVGLIEYTAAELPHSSQQIVQSEFGEWVKSSASNARDFCKTMLSTAFGAIPIFYAVLAFLNFKVTRPFWGPIVGLMPPTIFLISAVMFILAIRPQYAIIRDSARFDQFRRQRLLQMNTFILAGTILFLIATILSIIAFQLAVFT